MNIRFRGGKTIDRGANSSPENYDYLIKMDAFPARDIAESQNTPRKRTGIKRIMMTA
jgi:hypothetical protein